MNRIYIAHTFFAGSVASSDSRVVPGATYASSSQPSVASSVGAAQSTLDQNCRL